MKGTAAVLCDYACSAVTDAQGFRALRDEWTDLLVDAQRPNVFLSWDWMAAWMHAWRGYGVPHVVVLRRAGDGTLAGLAPLYRMSPRMPLGLRVLTFMGTGVGADHLAFLSRPGMDSAVSRGIMQYLLGLPTWDILDFPRMEEDSAAVVTDAVSAFDADGLTCSRTPADLCPFVPLPRSWDDYLGSIGRTNRTEMARRWRRLREQAEATVQRVQTEAQLNQAWDVLLRVHRARIEGAGGRSAFLTQRSIAFHERFLRLALDRGWLRFYVLQVNGRGVAANYCLNVGGRVSFVQTGFDSEWGRYGVGTLLLAHAIQEAIAEGALEFDLLRGTEAYKLQNWAAQVRQDVSLLIYRRSPKVRASMAARRWRSSIKRGLRGGWRSIVSGK